jgi:hypothetical protein
MFPKKSASERSILAGFTQRVCEGGNRFAVQNVENEQRADRGGFEAAAQLLYWSHDEHKIYGTFANTFPRIAGAR